MMINFLEAQPKVKHHTNTIIYRYHRRVKLFLNVEQITKSKRNSWTLSKTDAHCACKHLVSWHLPDTVNSIGNTIPG